MPEQAHSPPAQGWTEARHSSSSSTSSSLKRRQEDGGSPEGSQSALNDLSRGGFPIYNKKRKNTTRACDACKKRKVKCDGMQPCERCVKGGGDCTYNVKYTRGVFVAPLRNENLQHELSSPAQSSQLARLMDAVAAVSKTEIPAMLADISKLDKALNNDNDAQLSPSSARVSDAQPADQEDEGESFLGGSSNLVYSHSAKAHLLDEVQVPASPRNVPEQSQHRPLISSSSLRFSPSSRDHFWFAERPVEEVDARLLALPSRKLALQLVEWYFDNSSPTYRILHRPTVEHWIDCGFYSTQSEFDPVSAVTTEPVPTTRRCECDAHHPNPFEDRSICALMFSVWAMGSRFPVGIKPGSKEGTLLQRRGEQYFSIAEKELQQEKSLIDRLTSLQAKFIMCQYLLTTSRVKASWDLLSSVKNMANNLDLNRRNFRLPSSPADSLYIELRKRAFWAIYTLDTYMCTMIGKSLMLSDEDITVGLPEPVGDLSEVGKPTQLHTPLEHAKLSRILRVALRKLYSDIPLKSEELVTVTGQLGKMLQDWEDGLPQLLRRES
ncbi:fungal-specific transcription factor domain-containing protein [Myxozyma melibiosi]|uniref:Fungal-specific transcription factor domain-containing protein n=1 Tax=Myxozyma melibiosi TaxID=54550 RepID=A0ABR1F831_9ASCO